MTPPKFMFVEVNKRCNLRCNHCDFWKRDDKDAENYLSMTQLEGLVAEFRLMGGKSLVICGGEPMLDPDRYFGLCKAGRDAGLRVLSVVNGTRVQSVAAASQMVVHGPTEVNISFDDFREKDHDMFRGVTGSWKMASNAVRLMKFERREHLESGREFKINVMGLIHAGNYLELPRFYAFVLDELGADKLKLNFLQPSFGTDGHQLDDFFWKYSQIDEFRLIDVLGECERLFGVKYRTEWVESVTNYVRSLRGQLNLRRGWGSGVELEQDLCNSYERNIMLDHYGQAGWCFSNCAPRVMVKTGPELRAFWEDSELARMELGTLGCRRLCGISHSVRREKCYES